jgi:hypothetical protein
VSRGCRRVATMDHLWMPLLAHHFGDVVPPALLLLVRPARRFSALALTRCSVCKKILLPSMPRVDPAWSRYSAPGSCWLCGLLCCAKCHCRCRCLNEDCNDGMSTTHPFHEFCGECRGWAHQDCECIVLHCKWCHVGFCYECESEVLINCETCDDEYCRKCQRIWDVLGDLCPRCL